MKTWTRQILLAFVMGVVLPCILLKTAVNRISFDKQDPDIETRAVTTPTAQIPISVAPLYVYTIQDQGDPIRMELESYLCGVVMAEMPADFELEALKAQAVVARTYTLRHAKMGTKHPNGAVCTNPSCCQGYISQEDFLDRGGTMDGVNKVRNAVLSTAGQVLTYEGDLIDATYFSCSGGMTEDALAVWGNDVPYLQSVSSPGEEYAAHFKDKSVFTPAQVSRILGITLSGTPDSWFGGVTHTQGGGVDHLEICGKSYSGVELRSLLGLRSTNFQVMASESQIVFETLGFGHRVGMSQYGADAMAVDGNTYDQILSHYYQSTELINYSDIDNAAKSD